MKRGTIYMLVLALLLAMVPAHAEQGTGTLAELAARYVPLIGQSEAALVGELGDSAARTDANSHEATLEAQEALAGQEYSATLMYDGDALYGVRFDSGNMDAQSASDCAQALVALASEAYGAPDTYPVETTDATSVHEYWYFARPQHLTCDISTVENGEDGYTVCVQFALSAMPGVEYALGDEAAPYIELIGRPLADVCEALGLDETTAPDENGNVALDAVELMGSAYDRALVFGSDSAVLTGVVYTARDVQEGAVDVASALYMQAAQEYGEQDPNQHGDLPFMRAVSGLEAGSEAAATWSLPTADGSLSGLRLKLTTGIDAEGTPSVTLQYVLDA